MSESFYELKLLGLTRKLPICKITDELSIAGFVMFSDVELTVACAEAINSRLPEHDILITAESKGIPLAYEMSRQSGVKYILARKSIKLYMRNPVGVDVKSITTGKIQTLYLDVADRDDLRGKRVVIVDDVISTGESVRALEQLVKKSYGEVVARAAVLAEGEAHKRRDIIYLAKLPLLDNKQSD